MKIGIIILARTNFGRWPDKILFPLCGKPMFEWVIIKAKTLGIPVIVSTTENIEDQIIIDTAERLGAIVSIGNPDDRPERIAQAIIENNLDYFVFIPPCAPFFDIEYTKILITAITNNPGYDGYNIGVNTPAVPFGFRAQKVVNDLDDPNRDQEIFINSTREDFYRVYDHFGPELRNRYLMEYNIAFKIQAEVHRLICEHIGHFPGSYKEIRNALLEMEFILGEKK